MINQPVLEILDQLNSAWLFRSRQSYIALGDDASFYVEGSFNLNSPALPLIQLNGLLGKASEVVMPARR